MTKNVAVPEIICIEPSKHLEAYVAGQPPMEEPFLVQIAVFSDPDRQSVSLSFTTQDDNLTIGAPHKAPRRLRCPCRTPTNSLMPSEKQSENRLGREGHPGPVCEPGHYSGGWVPALIRCAG